MHFNWVLFDRVSASSRRVLYLVSALLLVVGCSGGNSGQGEPDEAPPATEHVTVFPNPVPGPDILGFESTAGWPSVVGIQFGVTTTDARTQGTKALSVKKPSGIVRLQSAALSSTNPELQKITRGSILAVDVKLPNEQINPFWRGELELFVTCPSRLLVSAPLGTVEFNGLRTGVYNTLKFRVPNFVADALQGASFSDLKFIVHLEVPVGSPGTYLLDNLRVKSTTLPPRPTDISQIHPGASILLEPTKTYSPPGGQVREMTFAQGLIQIPRSFHTLLGNAGTGTAKFEYRLGAGSTPVTCNYQGASAQARDYALVSCSSGALAGDLVAADWVRLSIVSGDAAAGQTKIQAQIALNPTGDEIIPGFPPIPTFFGENAAEYEAIMNAFIQEETNWTPTDPVSVRLPTPVMPKLDSGTLPLIDEDPDTLALGDTTLFSASRRMTDSDMADAEFHASATIAAPVEPDGARNLSFDAEAGVDVFVLGEEVENVAQVTAHVETHTGAPTAGNFPVTTGTGNVCFSILGTFGDCAETAGSFGTNEELFNESESVNLLPPLNFMVFSVRVTGVLAAKATAGGGITPTGISFGITPHASASVEISGGLAVGTFLGGGIFGRGDLITLDVPMTVNVTAAASAVPTDCNIHLNESFSGQAIVSSGSGAFGFYIEAGVTCGLFDFGCWREEGNVVTWDPLFSNPIDLIPNQPLADQIIPLPNSVCPQVDATGDAILYPPDGAVFHQGDQSFLNASNTIGFGDVRITLRNALWSSSDPSDVITNNELIRYGSPGLRTLTAIVSEPGIGQITDTVVIDVLPNDLSVAPVPQILAPLNRTQFGCDPISVLGIATDPQGDPFTLHWYVAPYEGPPNVAATEVATGNNPLIGQEGRLLRLIAIDSAGHQGLAEFDVFHLCLH